MKKQTFTSILIFIITIAVFLSSSCSMIKNMAAGSKPSINQNSSPAIDVSIPKHQANPSSKFPPAPGFEKFAIIDTENFYQTQSFTVSKADSDIVKNVHYNYAYTDGRKDSIHRYNTDASLEIFEFTSPEKAQAHLKEVLAKTIPEAQSASVKMSKCVGEKSDDDEFIGPDLLVKKLRHPNGSDIIVTHGGEYNMVDCSRSSGFIEEVSWADGAFYFVVTALPYTINRNEPDGRGYSRAEELAIDYLAALNQPVVR